jgi:hypothetical protein
LGKSVVKCFLCASVAEAVRPDKDVARRFIEFFTADVRNPNTGRAYARRFGYSLSGGKCTVRAALIFADLRLRERVIMKLAILAGMRPGEIFALRVGSLDWDGADIKEGVYRGVIDTPKTQKVVKSCP